VAVPTAGQIGRDGVENTTTEGVEHFRPISDQSLERDRAFSTQIFEEQNYAKTRSLLYPCCCIGTNLQSNDIVQ